VSVTGSELVTQINQARAGLRALGLRAGHRAVLIAPNSIAWVAIDLAIIAEGAIAVPMYVRQKPEELTQLLSDCLPSVVVCDDETLATTLRNQSGMAQIVTLEHIFSGKEVHEPVRQRHQEVPVTILYTSGTSAAPRGVMLTEANLRFMLSITTAAFGRLVDSVHGAPRVFHYLPFCFAGSRVMLMTCLLRGQHLMLSMDLDRLPQEISEAAPHYFLNVPALLERIKKKVESGVGAKPWLWALYLRAKRAYGATNASAWDRAALLVAKWLLFRPIRRKIGGNLRCLICGSAPLHEETQRFFHMLGIPVYQVYGLTETTAIVTMDSPDAAGRVGFVGRAIEGCQLKLGQGGELCVKGANVFAGYWGKDAETRSVIDSEGWFHTGDQAEVDDLGNWRIVGRLKNMLVPTSGHNVAPEPIEDQLLSRLPAANHVVLVGHAKPYLTAIVSGELTEAQAKRAIDEVNQSQPHYKCIRGFVVTHETFTPDNGLLTANQKLRRGAVEERFRQEINRLYS
jgi:long-chain acyl-CoA synthetase